MSPSFYAAIRKFLRDTDMKPSRLGRLSVNDPRVISDILFHGRELRSSTQSRILKWIEDYRADPRKASKARKQST